MAKKMQNSAADNPQSSSGPSIVDNFKSTAGNWLIGENLEEAKVIDFIQSEKGYTVESLAFNGRHIVGRLSRESTVYFFKLSTTEGIGEKALNEISFNHILEEVSGVDEMTSTIRPLKIIESGDYEEGLPYFIAEHLPLEWGLENINPDLYPGILKKLAKINVFLNNMSDRKTYKNDVEDRIGQNVPVKLSEKAPNYYALYENFAREVGDTEDLTGLLELVKGYEKMDRFGLNHSDLAIKNIFVDPEGKIIITDGENSSARLPWLFDTACLYVKLHTFTARPDLARLYLQEIVKYLTGEELEYFKFAFRVMVASKVIGGFWEYSKVLTLHDTIKNSPFDVEAAKQLKQLVIEDRLFEGIQK